MRICYLQTQISPNNVDESSIAEVPIRFQPFTSLLDSYPLLRAHSQANLPEHTAHELCPPAAHPLPSSSHINLTPLKLLTIRKCFPGNASMICQYEVPGGGECRDRDCQDVHLSRLPPVDPSGTHAPLFTRFADYMTLASLAIPTYRIVHHSKYSLLRSTTTQTKRPHSI